MLDFQFMRDLKTYNLFSIYKQLKSQFHGMGNFEEMGRGTREGVEILKDGVLEVRCVPG